MGRFDVLTRLEPQEEPQRGPSASPTSAGDRTGRPASQPARKAADRHGIMTPRHHDTTTPRYHDTMTPQEQSAGLLLAEDGLFELVRKAVKKIGKEAATHRFTLAEKQQLADIEYTYKRRGIRTTENELTRIAINYFIEDYRLNGEQSLLAQLLDKINS
jgi:hypothetical protein